MRFRPFIQFVLVAVVVVGVVGLSSATPAQASTASPPFEVVFPQETAKTEFSDTFGAARSGGRSHKGTDLMTERMTEVYAVADGVVSYVGINNLSGRNIKIDHGGGWESYYLHLNNDNLGTDDGDAPWTMTVAPGVEVGTWVGAGQLIAWAGDSGNAEWTSPHTHFELRRDGSALNAYSVLLDAYERDRALQEALADSPALDLADYAIE